MKFLVGLQENQTLTQNGCWIYHANHLSMFLYWNASDVASWAAPPLPLTLANGVDAKGTVRQPGRLMEKCSEKKLVQRQWDWQTGKERPLLGPGLAEPGRQHSAELFRHVNSLSLSLCLALAPVGFSALGNRELCLMLARDRIFLPVL